MNIRQQLRADLLAPIAQHLELVGTIKSVPDSPASEVEIIELTDCLVTIRDDSKCIPAVIGKIFAHSVRFTAVAIHLLRTCDQGVTNGLTEHWDALNANTQAQLTYSLSGRLLVIRERGRHAHNLSDEQIEETVQELMQRLGELPLAIREKLIETSEGGQLNISLVLLIQKLHMLQSEWPEMMAVELESVL